MIEIKQVTSETDLAKVHEIRKIVFIEEQNVSKEEEYEFEEESRHFLAISDGIPCGTARWRYTDKGIKLERFAVLKEFRSFKVGSSLVKALLEDIQNSPNTADKMYYVHAQVTAMGLYGKFGFEPVGDMFMEANMEHYKMVLY